MNTAIVRVRGKLVRLELEEHQRTHTGEKSFLHISCVHLLFYFFYFEEIINIILQISVK